MSSFVVDLVSSDEETEIGNLEPGAKASSSKTTKVEVATKVGKSRTYIESQSESQKQDSYDLLDDLLGGDAVAVCPHATKRAKLNGTNSKDHTLSKSTSTSTSSSSSSNNNNDGTSSSNVVSSRGSFSTAPPKKVSKTNVKTKSDVNTLLDKEHASQMHNSGISTTKYPTAADTQVYKNNDIWLGVTIESSFSSSVPLQNAFNALPMEKEKKKKKSSSAAAELSQDSTDTVERVPFPCYRESMMYSGLVLFHCWDDHYCHHPAIKKKNITFNPNAVAEAFYVNNNPYVEGSANILDMNLCVYSPESFLELATADQNCISFELLNNDINRMITCAINHGMSDNARIKILMIDLSTKKRNFIHNQQGGKRYGVYDDQRLDFCVHEAITFLLMNKKIEVMLFENEHDMIEHVLEIYGKLKNTKSLDEAVTELKRVQTSKIKDANDASTIWREVLQHIPQLSKPSSKIIASINETSCPLHVFNFLKYGNIDGKAASTGGTVCDADNGGPRIDVLNARKEELCRLFQEAGVNKHKVVSNSIAVLFGSPTLETLAAVSDDA
jgi:hypothetical protein